MATDDDLKDHSSKIIGLSSFSRSNTLRSLTSVSTAVTGKERPAPSAHQPTKEQTKLGYAIFLTYLGRKGYSQTLYAATPAIRTKWLDTIRKRQTELMSHAPFRTIPLCEDFFTNPSRAVVCAASYGKVGRTARSLHINFLPDSGTKMLYGTTEGVYYQDVRESVERRKPPVRVVAMKDVTQVSIIERPYDLLLVLAGKFADVPCNLAKCEQMDASTAFR